LCYLFGKQRSEWGKGKSGGARVITHFAVTDDTIYLLTIYDKSDKEDLSDNELAELLKFID
jgi:hypothetical protein